jgi:hypothetical protein
MPGLVAVYWEKFGERCVFIDAADFDPAKHVRWEERVQALSSQPGQDEKPSEPKPRRRSRG